MLRAAHYKADAVDGPAAGKSPPKHRPGGILDLALTAADKYALSLLPAALKGTGIAGSDGPATDFRSAPQHPTNGLTPAFKMQRPSQPPEMQLQPGLDSRVASSWDASLKEILAALEPETRTLKPAKLRDHKYPNQNHGMPANTVIPSPRRELDEALVTLSTGTRRGKSSVPAYANAFKGASRQSRRPELQAVDVQYDVVPSVKLAWAGPGTATYSTTGFGGSPKKYTSQLVGRVSPHYAGIVPLAASLSTPAGTQDPLHLPEIANGNSHGAAHQQGSFKGGGNALPNLQTWTNSTAQPSAAGNARRALPYVSPNAPSLAKPLTVQYHPVLKSPSLGRAPGLQYAQPLGTSSSGAASRSASQRPATDQGSSSEQGGDGEGPSESSRPYPRSAYGGQPARLPQTPPEVAAEVARLRHAQELDGVINGVRTDLLQAAAPRFDAPVKSKFLQMYEDPNRPLTKLNPKQLLGDAPSHHHRRHRPPNLAVDRAQVCADGRPSSTALSSSGTASRSPMYERRLRPLPSNSHLEQGIDAGVSAGPEGNDASVPSDGDALGNVHLQPPELPEHSTLEVGLRLEQLGLGTGTAMDAESPMRSTPRSSVLDREEAALTMADFRAPSIGSGAVAVTTDGEDREPRGEAEAFGAEYLADVEEAAPAGSEITADAEAGAELESGLPAAVLDDGEGTAAGPVAGSEPLEQAVAVRECAVQEGQPQPVELPACAYDAVSASPQDAQLKLSASGSRDEAGLPQQQAAVDLEQQQPSSSEPGGTVPGAEPGQDLSDPMQADPLSWPEDGEGPHEPVCAADDEQSLLECAADTEGPLDSAAAGPANAVVQDVDRVASGDGADQSTDAGAAPPSGLEGGQPGADGAEVISPDADAVAAPSPDVVTEPESRAETEAPDAACVPPADAEGVTASEAPQPGGAVAEPVEAEVGNAAVDIPPGGSEDAADGRVTAPEAVEAAGEASGLQPVGADAPAASASDSAGPAERPNYTLPPGVTPQMARVSVVCIQSHARGYQARRRMAAMRREREAARAGQQGTAAEAPTESSPPSRKQGAYELPPGVTPEMADAAVVRIQSHARGYLTRRQVAELRKGREAGAAALSTAATAVAMHKLEGYELKDGVTAEMAEAAAIRVQAHMRGHLARRRVKHMRAELSPTVEASAVDMATAPCDTTAAAEGQPEEGDTTLREEGEAVSSGVGTEDAGAPQPTSTVPEELTIDALNAAIADDEEGGGDLEGGQDDAEAAASHPEATAAEERAAALDMSDPAAVAAAAAAAKGAIRLLDDGGYGLDSGIADTTAAADQAADEASMARLAASSARTSAMFQGAGAEMRFSDDEASALELMDNLDGLLQGDDEAAAAAAAVAAATAPADGEMVSISAEGVSEPQALSGTGAVGAPTNPMDQTEPGGVRVLAGKYEVQHVVGEGAYGMVMKCKVRGTEPVQWVAIKEFKIDDNDPDAEDVKRTSLREVAVLEALQHPHVVGFVDKFMVGDRLFIVMEFLPCNLLELLEAQPGGMDRDAVRLIMFQLCSAIAFIHTKNMVYRDIKPENLLVDEHGTVKLCDFGFARYVPSSPSSHLTDYVATRWYRAPELLLGPPYRDALGKHIQYMYGPPVDMWAVGCLMGELLDGEPLFAGDSDLDQLYRVQQILGPMAPSHQYMFYANPHNTGIVFNIKQPMTLAARYRGKVSEVELSFMAGLLEMDPDKRLTGEQCLQHPYLVDLAAAASVLPTPTPTDSNTATATNLSADDTGTSGGASANEADPAAAQAGGGAAEGEGSQGEPVGPERSGPRPALGAGASPSMRLSESREGLESRGIEKAGSLTRAAGSLTRGGRSLSRGNMSPVLLTPAGSSPVPATGPQRAASKLQASENGNVVIVEGLEEGEEQEDAEARGSERGMTGGKSISALAEVAEEVSEIEPIE